MHTQFNRRTEIECIILGLLSVIWFIYFEILFTKLSKDINYLGYDPLHRLIFYSLYLEI